MEAERKDKNTRTYRGHVEHDIVPSSRVQGNCFNTTQVTRWLCVTNEQ